MTPDDIEAVRDSLDAKIAADQLKPKSAMNAWGLVSVIFDTAAHAKKATGLRVRADDPCRDIKPPEQGDAREGPYLYPNEYLAFAEAESTPVVFAQLATVELCQRLRAGEGYALQVTDVDLAHDTLAIDRATDKFTGATVEPKTGAGRRVMPIEANVGPLLAHLVAQAKATGRACSSTCPTAATSPRCCGSTCWARASTARGCTPTTRRSGRCGGTTCARAA